MTHYYNAPAAMPGPLVMQPGQQQMPYSYQNHPAAMTGPLVMQPGQQQMPSSYQNHPVAMAGPLVMQPGQQQMPSSYQNLPVAMAGPLVLQPGQQQMPSYPAAYTNAPQNIGRQYTHHTDNDEFLIIHTKSKPSTLKKKLRELVRYARWRRLQRELNAVESPYTISCDLKSPLNATSE